MAAKLTRQFSTGSPEALRRDLTRLVEEINLILSRLQDGSGFQGLTGDVEVDPNSTAATVVGWQGQPVSADAPSEGDVMVYENGIWVPKVFGTGAIQKFTTLNSPVGLWNFDSTLAADVGPDLTVEAGAEYYGDIIPGKPGFYFNGGTRLVATAHDASLVLTGACTILMILMLDSNPSTSNLVAHGANNELESGNVVYWMAVDGDVPKRLKAEWEHSAGTNVSYTTTGTASLGTIHNPTLIAMSRSASGVVQFYQNGRPLGVASSALTLPTGGADASTRLRVGSVVGTENCDVMICWGLKIMNFEYTADQHKTEYNVTLGPGYGLIP